MRRLLSAFLIALVVALASPVAVSAVATDEEILGMVAMDIAIATADAGLDEALLLLRVDAHSAPGIDIMAETATEALTALRAISPAPCFLEWYAVELTRWLMWEQVTIIEGFTPLPGDNSQAQAIGTGFALGHFGDQLRAQAPCGVPAPIPPSSGGLVT